MKETGEASPETPPRPERANQTAVLSGPERESLLAEYSALRAEILILIQDRNKFLLFDLGGFGFVFAWAVSSQHPDKTFFLVAPLIHYPVALYWEYVDRQIIRIGRHIKDNIEARLDGMSWETRQDAKRSTTWKQSGLNWIKKFIPVWRPPKYSRTELSGLMIFMGTTALSISSWLSWYLISQTSPEASELALTSPIPFTALLLILDIAIFPYILFIIHNGRNLALRDRPTVKR